jgi:Alkaline phytoceramidase (aPHC).
MMIDGIGVINKRNTAIYMSQKIKLLILLLVCLLAFAAMFFVKPIPQDEAYHHFADRRVMLGIPNFWNVISNIPLFLVGLIGTIAGIKKKWVGFDTPAHSAYLLFFLGVGLTGLGSAYYHLNPSTSTLFWDRLPMALSFMAFFSLIIDLRQSRRFENVNRSKRLTH